MNINISFLYAVALATCIGLSACTTPPQSQRASQAPALAPQAQQHPDLGHEHIPFPEFPHAAYNSNPPSSGAHTGYTAPWGNHMAPVANEVLLHNLEHGGVIIGYRCEHCPKLVAELVELAGDHSHIIIAPNPTLDSPVGLSAWVHTLTLDAPNVIPNAEGDASLNAAAKAAIKQFIETHHGVDHHPSTGHGHTAAPQGDQP